MGKVARRPYIFCIQTTSSAVCRGRYPLLPKMRYAGQCCMRDSPTTWQAVPPATGLIQARAETISWYLPDGVGCQSKLRGRVTHAAVCARLAPRLTLDFGRWPVVSPRRCGVRSNHACQPIAMPAVLGLTNISGDQASQFKVESGCNIGTVLQAGTSCTLNISYVAGLIPQSHAVLQLRSDQTNPSAVRLQGTLTPQEAAEPVLVPPGVGSGGGCAFTSDPSRSRDITLIAALMAAALALKRKRRIANRSMTEKCRAQFPRGA